MLPAGAFFDVKKKGLDGTDIDQRTIPPVFRRPKSDCLKHELISPNHLRVELLKTLARTPCKCS
jgi:hypothetical protein